MSRPTQTRHPVYVCVCECLFVFAVIGGVLPLGRGQVPWSVSRAGVLEMLERTEVRRS